MSSDSAGAFLISNNFIDLTLHTQNIKQLDGVHGVNA